jgi:hypothetical protein
MFIEAYNQYNLFAVGESVLAIHQQLGPIDLAWSEKELTERYDCRNLFFVPSRYDAESRIDMFQLQQVGRNLSERLAESELMVRDLSGRLAESERAVRDLSGRLVESEQRLARLEGSIIFRALRKLRLFKRTTD